jgi:hypothetical protein
MRECVRLQTLTTSYRFLPHPRGEAMSYVVDHLIKEVSMKSLIALLMLATTLAGCVAVPVYEPAPSYGYYYYPAPAPNVQFQYRYYRR